jgi:hypothetical protein
MDKIILFMEKINNNEDSKNEFTLLMNECQLFLEWKNKQDKRLQRRKSEDTLKGTPT